MTEIIDKMIESDIGER